MPKTSLRGARAHPYSFILLYNFSAPSTAYLYNLMNAAMADVAQLKSDARMEQMKLHLVPTPAMISPDTKKIILVYKLNIAHKVVCLLPLFDFGWIVS
nr:non-specific lipid-transfer protein [Ipomoea batatas]GMD20051.1 non-specific lipid-transfer protein [Ipomoea batatas]